MKLPAKSTNRSPYSPIFSFGILFRVFECEKYLEPVKVRLVVRSQEKEVIQHRLQKLEKIFASRNVITFMIWKYLESIVEF